MRFHCFASCIKRHLRFASWYPLERSDGSGLLLPLAFDALNFEIFMAYSVSGKLAVDISEMSDVSPGLRGSPWNSFHPRNSGPRARGSNTEATATDDDDAGRQMIVFWSRHSARVLRSQVQSLRSSFPS